MLHVHPEVVIITLGHLLKDIRFSENPIVDPAQGGVPRFVLVARLAKAKILNGSEVCSEFCKPLFLHHIIYYDLHHAIHVNYLYDHAG